MIFFVFSCTENKKISDQLEKQKTGFNNKMDTDTSYKMPVEEAVVSDDPNCVGFGYLGYRFLASRHSQESPKTSQK